MRRWRRWVAAMCGVVAAGVGLGAWMIDDTRDTAALLGAIVVLGARVQPDGTASATLEARARHGAALFKKGLAPLLIFSGGVGVNPPSEASVARDIVVSLGVPDVSCVLEERSHSTRENAKFTAAMLRDRNIKNVILVSDPYHLGRARWLFEHQGIEVTVSPVLEAPRHRSSWLRAEWSIRELASFAKDVTLTWLE